MIAQLKAWGLALAALVGLGWLLTRQAERTGAERAGRKAAQQAVQVQKEMLDVSTQRPTSRDDRARILRDGEY